ncbi:MAG: tetratricopeptide repeat protein [Polymorphobacter sp.]|uniref:tetratricopeptide repeat protein n=1 Tax=Polymorphobacter sp. TaxID=1909290 RepID=UPI003A899CE9
MSLDQSFRGVDAKALLKSGAALGAVGASLVDGGAAEAGNKALKAEADALRQAAAARAAASRPAAEAPADHYARAKLLLAGGDVPGAMAAFRRVLAEEPRSVDAMNGLGVTYDRMGRHDVARGWYEAALAVAPEDGAVLANLGYSLTLQGEWREAIPWLQAAARSRDATAVANARRLLVRVNAELTAARTREPVFARPAEIALQVPVPVPAPVRTAPVQLAAVTPVAKAPPPVVADSPVPVASVEVASVAVPPSVGFAPAPREVLSPVAMPDEAIERVAAPQPDLQAGAHIEFAANGEAQLVMGGAPAPAAALVASLGDAAVLVLAPQAPVALAPLVEQVETARLAEAAPPRARRAVARPRARLQPALVTVEMPVATLSLAAAPEITLIPALVAARAEADAMLVAAAPVAAPVETAARQVVRQAVARVETARALAATEDAPVDIMAFASDDALAPAALARTSVASVPVMRAPVSIGVSGPLARAPGSPEADPAWLLHVRRAGPDGRTAPSAPALALRHGDIGGTRLFESDDGALNSFAARMRGPQGAGIDPGSAVARQAAIARLERVIARVRAA